MIDGVRVGVDYRERLYSVSKKEGDRRERGREKSRGKWPINSVKSGGKYKLVGWWGKGGGFKTGGGE